MAPEMSGHSHWCVVGQRAAGMALREWMPVGSSLQVLRQGGMKGQGEGDSLSPEGEQSGVRLGSLAGTEGVVVAAMETLNMQGGKQI